MLFQLVDIDSSGFGMVYGLVYYIYYDKIGIISMVKKELLDKAMRHFISAQVMTLSQLELLLSCSQRSVQRYLAKWLSLRSYNHNGKYFSLPAIVHFDSFGIWKYNDIGFSKFGNLKETVVHLVARSAAGLTASELGEILSANAHSFMSQFRVDLRLKREKCDGVLVYFCSDHDIRIAQKRKRFTNQPLSALPSDTQAVTILVSLLKNPKATIEELVRINKGHNGISSMMVERLLEQHGLLKKK